MGLDTELEEDRSAGPCDPCRTASFRRRKVVSM